MSLSIEEVDAERIRSAAAESGMDLSHFIRDAVMAEVSRLECAALVFAEIDERISHEDLGAAEMTEAPSPSDGELSQAERQRLQRKWDDLLGPHQARGAA